MIITYRVHLVGYFKNYGEGHDEEIPTIAQCTVYKCRISKKVIPSGELHHMAISDITMW